MLLFILSLSYSFIDASFDKGQYRPIRAVRFIAENTVEERILQLQEKKRLVFDGTVGRYVSLTMSVPFHHSPYSYRTNHLLSQGCWVTKDAHSRRYEVVVCVEVLVEKEERATLDDEI